MVSSIQKDTVDLFERYLSDFEPYNISILDDLMFDDKRYEENRLFSTVILKRMIQNGFSEDEVNPWKKK